jgi:hypothetical protein
MEAMVFAYPTLFLEQLSKESSQKRRQKNTEVEERSSGHRSCHELAKQAKEIGHKPIARQSSVIVALDGDGEDVSQLMLSIDTNLCMSILCDRSDCSDCKHSVIGTRSDFEAGRYGAPQHHSDGRAWFCYCLRNRVHEAIATPDLRVTTREARGQPATGAQVTWLLHN